MTYGLPPIDLGEYRIRCTETMYYQSMPIKLPGQNFCKYGKRLAIFDDLIGAVAMDAKRWTGSYVYITAKHTFVGPGAAPNRPGWHSDGFGTNDVSYLWFDSVPTIYNTSPFSLSNNHTLSMLEMGMQALPENDVAAPCHHLLRFDPSVIHRVGDVLEPGMRTFVKIVVSDRPHNLVGNTRNYKLDYNWPMYERQAGRNDPSKPVEDDPQNEALPVDSSSSKTGLSNCQRFLHPEPETPSPGTPSEDENGPVEAKFPVYTLDGLDLPISHLTPDAQGNIKLSLIDWPQLGRSGCRPGLTCPIRSNGTCRACRQLAGQAWPGMGVKASHVAAYRFWRGVLGEG